MCCRASGVKVFVRVDEVPGKMACHVSRGHVSVIQIDGGNRFFHRRPLDYDLVSWNEQWIYPLKKVRCFHRGQKNPESKPVHLFFESKYHLLIYILISPAKPNHFI